MLRSVWEWILQLDATLAAALVAAVVSMLATVITILFTPVGSYLLAKRQLRDRLETEYQYEQRKKLRDLIGRYHGRILQAVEEFNLMWAATDTHLFEGLAYDATESKDHLFRDTLRQACDCCWIKGENGVDRFVTLSELSGMMGQEPALYSVLEFFNNLRANEDRYRWDRLVTLHLIILAFIDDFGWVSEWCQRRTSARVA